MQYRALTGIRVLAYLHNESRSSNSACLCLGSRQRPTNFTRKVLHKCSVAIFALASGLDLQNDSEVGKILNNGHITRYFLLDPVRQPWVKFMCFTPHESRNQLTWHLFGRKTADVIAREYHLATLQSVEPVGGRSNTSF